jgi:flagellar basal body-associated protein FliL
MEPTIMSNPSMPSQEGAPKSKTWLWIVIIVAVVLLLCCCLVVVGVVGLPVILAVLGDSVQNVFDQINSGLQAP